MSTRLASYAAPSGHRIGTAQRDWRTGSVLHGEVNQDGRPMGGRAATPITPNLDRMQAGQTAPSLSNYQRWNAPSAGGGGGSAAPAASPVAATGRLTGQPLPVPVGGSAQPPAASPVASPGMAGMAATPAPSPFAAGVNILSGTAQPDADQRALVAQSNAAHLAARTTAPIPLPEGDPAARAFWSKQGMGHPSTPEPGAAAPAPAASSAAPNPALLAAAGTGAQVQSQYGTGSSTMAPAGSTPSAPITTADGVRRSTWQDQVVKMYPNIGKAGTPENAAFTQSYNANPGQNPFVLAQMSKAPVVGAQNRFQIDPAQATTPATTPPENSRPLPLGNPSDLASQWSQSSEQLGASTVAPPPPATREDSALPTASGSTPSVVPPASTVKPPAAPTAPSWRNPFAAAPDFMPAGLPGGRPGGTQGLTSSTPDFPAPGLPGGRYGGTGGVTSPMPDLDLTKPKKAATPIWDRVAQSY